MIFFGAFCSNLLITSQVDDNLKSQVVDLFDSKMICSDYKEVQSIDTGEWIVGLILDDIPISSDGPGLRNCILTISGIFRYVSIRRQLQSKPVTSFKFPVHHIFP